MAKGSSPDRKGVTKEGRLEHQEGRKYNEKSKYMSKYNRFSLPS